jgi:phosphoribosyl 1,2-cyclic phosphate phosphodiesterase
LEVIVLGTGTSQGIPQIGCKCEVCCSSDKKDKRLRTSILIKVSDRNILIDAGPDFRQQMLNESIDKVDAIIFTHEHRDHIGGLDDVRTFNFMTKEPMDIYAEQRVQAALRKDFSYIFTANYPGIPRLNLNTITEEAFFIANIKIQPIRVMHYNLPILGFRINDFTYITDANFMEEEEKLKILGSKVVFINALRKEKHISHYSLEEAIEVINQVSPRETYFTHLSHHMGLHEDVTNELPANMKIAYDGLRILV